MGLAMRQQNFDNVLHVLPLDKGQRPPLGIMDCFAAQLAEHDDIELAAAAIGVSAIFGRGLFQLICRELGSQAV